MEYGSYSRMKVAVYPLIIIFALLVIRINYSVLFFHTLAELFSVFVGLLMLVVVLNTQHFVRNDFLIYLGIGYFSISILDALHAFTINGMPFFNITTGEITIHLWIYSRLFEALLLLSAAFFLRKRLHVKIMVMVSTILVCIIVLAAFYLEQPIMFIDGKLSSFKVYTEFLVIILLASSIVIYWQKKALFEKNVLFFLISSILLTIAAELCFTLYMSFEGNAFVIGHIFKFLSFWMIYQAIIQTTLNEPLKLLTISSNSYDAIPNPAIRIDEFTMISQVNRAASQVVNEAVETLIHQPVHRYFHPNENDENSCVFCQAIKNGETLSAQEVYFSHLQQWYLLSISPIDPLNKKGGMVQSLTNITYQKEQEAELLDNKNLLEKRVKERTEALELSFKELAKTQAELVESKKMASLGDLVAGVAHEINTPVGICITSASYLSELTALLKSDFDNERVSITKFGKYICEAEKSSALIVSNLTRAAELVNSFKQVAVDQSSECLRVFLIKQYVTEIILSLSPTLKRRKIIINFDSSNDFQVHTSPSALVQILTNFIINSLTHAFELDRCGEILISVKKVDDEVVLIYQDSGKGISSDDLEKIYDPFFTTKRGQGGSGLGLHITYNLIHQSLNGSITCNSTLGQGVTFTVKFPVNKILISS